MDRNDVQIISKQTVFNGFFRIDRYTLQHRLHNGEMSVPLEREVANRGHIVAVLPVDVDRDQVILIEQFRAGALAAGWKPWLIECVAGIVEDGEEVEAVARRETAEECGCVIDDLLPIHHFLTTPGALSETVSLFCGRTNCQGAGGTYGVRDEGEDIHARVYTIEQALALLPSGAIANAITLVALQWLTLHYKVVKERWSKPQS